MRAKLAALDRTEIGLSNASTSTSVSQPSFIYTWFENIGLFSPSSSIEDQLRSQNFRARYPRQRLRRISLWLFPASVKEFVVSVDCTVASLNPPSPRQSVQHEGNGLCAVGFMDDHYHVRSAFSLLNEVLDEYQKMNDLLNTLLNTRREFSEGL
ncbi:unnamed protein product [Microthlaspi erraticum]|uniref:Longin domain-containing protein n=1 Tax=Microthlaspi erraticum TaxID=1685480 RepID=A0A6D2K9V5_9BRAS|nr:unnamed protein product [Microthlaspi erraticum]